MARQMECDALSDQQLVDLIAEDTAYLKCASLRTREYCMNFMQKMARGIDPELLKDIYHDALIVLFEKARPGAFRLTCSLQTYLNSVCRNQLLNVLRRDARTKPLNEGSEGNEASEHEQYSDAVTDWLHPGDAGINNERVQ